MRHPTLAECEAAGRGPDNYPGKPYDSGGLLDTPDERARFEAYMRGHCWEISKYDEALGAYEDTFTRCMYGVWRDRGALTTTVQPTIDGCPCLLAGACSYACTCVNPYMMSGGCKRCCKYGSMEQRIAAAKRLAGV